MSGDPTTSQSPDGTLSSQQPSRFLTLLVGAVGLLLAVLTVAGVRAYRDLAEARDLESKLEQLVTEADLRVAVLEDRIGRLRDDDDALERVAREELGMLFPDEFVVLLPDPPATGATTEDEPTVSPAQPVR